jgi:biopolymer transport protein ExbB/TolQ
MALADPRKAQIRLMAALLAMLGGALFIGICSLLLPAPDNSGKMAMSAVLFGMEQPTDNALYPFTIQNVMWMVFFVGLGELWLRFQAGSLELRQLGWGLLPEDDKAMLRSSDLVPIYNRIKERPDHRDLCLPRLINRVILQFQGSQSIDQANTLLNSSLELMQHELELKYNWLRYITWLIPTLGFIGTVVGIALALANAAAMPDPSDIQKMQDWVVLLTTRLGIAFNTTLVALLQAAVLVALMHVTQEREETALNFAGQYCLDNLINRLYV